MDDDLLKKLIGKMMPLLDERNRRLFLGILADCLGRGSVTKLNQITKACLLQFNKKKHGVTPWYY